MRHLSLVERKALETLADGPLSCTELGERLFSSACQSNPPRQAFARPAGKLLHRLQRLGLTDYRWYGRGRDRRCKWYAK